MGRVLEGRSWRFSVCSWRRLRGGSPVNETHGLWASCAVLRSAVPFALSLSTAPCRLTQLCASPWVRGPRARLPRPHEPAAAGGVAPSVALPSLG